jgi:hypothetical protein
MTAFTLSLLFGGATFSTLFVSGLGARRRLNSNVRRLRQMLGMDSDILAQAAATAQAKTYNAAYQAHLLLERFNIGHTLDTALEVKQRLQIVLAAAAFLISLGFDLPFPLALAATVVVYWVPNQLAKSTWRKAQDQVAEDLLMLITDIGSLVQFTANPLEALVEAEQTLRLTDNQLLADELQRTIMDVRRYGDRGWVRAEERVQTLSSTLAMLYFTLRRLKQTGGVRFGENFKLTADNLIEIQGVRTQINSRTQSARSTMNMIAIILALIFANMLSSATMRQAYMSPVGQLTLAGSVLLMGFGYWYIFRRIEKAQL